MRPFLFAAPKAPIKRLLKSARLGIQRLVPPASRRFMKYRP